MAKEQKTEKKDPAAGKSEAEPSHFKGLYLRALADYQNLKKQSEKEKAEFARFSNQTMIEDLLPLFEHLNTALEHANSGNGCENLKKGLKILTGQFKELLGKYGVEEVGEAGEAFDYNLMEAVETVDPGLDEQKEGRVARVLKKGYRLNGRIIKPAIVAVFDKIVKSEHNIQ